MTWKKVKITFKDVAYVIAVHEEVCHFFNDLTFCSQVGQTLVDSQVPPGSTVKMLTVPEEGFGNAIYFEFPESSVEGSGGVASLPSNSVLDCASVLSTPEFQSPPRKRLSWSPICKEKTSETVQQSPTVDNNKAEQNQNNLSMTSQFKDMSPFKSPVDALDSHELDLGCDLISWTDDDSILATSEVEVSNIPSPFFKDHFLHRLKEEILKNVKTCSSSDLIVNCSEFNSVSASVTVQFLSQEVARQVVELRSIIYRGNVLRFFQNCTDVINNNVSVTPVLSQLKMCNLHPPPFFEDYFAFLLEEAILNENIIDLNGGGFLKCFDYNKDESSVVVEFSSPDIAQKVLSLKNIKVDGRTIRIQPHLLNTTDSGKLTSEVVVSNLPQGQYFEDYFIYCLQETMYDVGLVDKRDFGIVCCSDHNKEAASVVVKFVTVDLAEKFCSLKEVTFEMEKLTRKQKLSDTSEQSFTLLLPEVVVSGIPTPFFKDFFLHTLNLQVWEAGIMQAPEEAIVGCSSYNDLEKSVAVEFKSSVIAQKFCAIDKVFYRNSTLLLKQKVGSGKAHCSLSRTVLVGNVKEPFFKDEFVHIIHTKLWFDCLVSDGKSVIVSCSDLDNKGNVILKFDSPQSAQFVSSFVDVSYLKQNLSFSIMPTEDNTSASLTKPEIRNLESEESTTLLVKTLLRLRHLFAHGKPCEPGIARVERDLKDIHSINTTIHEIRTKRKAMLDKYRRLKRQNNKSWHLYMPMAVLCKDEDIEVLKGTPFDEKDLFNENNESFPPKVKSGVETFTKGKIWITPAVRALISICIENKVDYDKPVRHTVFWQNVHSILRDDFNYHYSPAQCESKMEENKRLFKNEVLRLGQSGAEGPASAVWPFYADMLPLMEGDVSVWPLLTVAAGTTSVAAKAVRSVGAHGSQTIIESQPDSNRSTKERPAVLRRPQSGTEKQTSALANVVEALKESNNLKRQLIEKLGQK